MLILILLNCLINNFFEKVHEGSEIKPVYRKSDFSARPNDLKIKEIIDSSSPPNEKVLYCL